jgi:hypothetical protein
VQSMLSPQLCTKSPSLRTRSSQPESLFRNYAAARSRALPNARKGRLFTA